MITTIELEELKDRIEARKRACENLSDDYVRGKHTAYITVIAEITEILGRVKKGE